MQWSVLALRYRYHVLPSDEATTGSTRADLVLIQHGMRFAVRPVVRDSVTTSHALFAADADVTHLDTSRQRLDRTTTFVLSSRLAAASAVRGSINNQPSRHSLAVYRWRHGAFRVTGPLGKRENRPRAAADLLRHVPLQRSTCTFSHGVRPRPGAVSVPPESIWRASQSWGPSVSASAREDVGRVLPSRVRDRWPVGW